MIGNRVKYTITIQQTQRISLEILHTIASICEENGFRYYLFYGTLIGAVRHHGYIPWDDDVDIMMPRPDYDQLLNYLSKNISKFPNLKVFNHDVNPKYPYMITRISDDRYRIVMANEKPYGMGVFIDIYPFDGLGNTEEEALKYGLKGDHLSSICYQATRDHFAIETTTSPLRKMVKFPFYLFSKAIGKERLQDKLEKLARVKPYDDNKYVGCVVWLSGGEKDIFPREWFDEYIEVPFEEYTFRIPRMYDKILKHIYGDYMKLPPENERVGHHDYQVYKK